MRSKIQEQLLRQDILKLLEESLYPMSRSWIARTLGVHWQQVNRILEQLQKENLVRAISWNNQILFELIR